MKLYTMTNSSMYVQITKVRYVGKDYVKVNLAYFTKPGKTLITTEKNVKLKKSAIAMWETVVE